MSAHPEVEVGGYTYRLRPLMPMQQLHVVRRLAPVLVSLGVTVGADGKPIMGNPFEMLTPAADVLAAMPDETVEYLINTCLAAVDRKTTNGYARVIVNNANMFNAEMDIGVMFQLTWEVGKANLSGFMRTLQSLVPKKEGEGEVQTS